MSRTSQPKPEINSGEVGGDTVAPGLKQVIQQALPKLVQLIQPEVTVPTYGQFHPVDTAVHNPDQSLFAGRIRFIVRSDFDDIQRRYFDIRVETPSGRSYASTGYPIIGTKQELLDILHQQIQDPSLILNNIHQSAQLLKEADKA